ncbi:MAG TPA: class I SAM-dependent methyltransferase [Polyangiaceae bacterium]|nr:class I SAM-dependent methyltransferase [Polyangiaceae bacterium]
MSEYDRADFEGVYKGRSLIESAEIKAVPWEIGAAQPIICEILDGLTHRVRLLDVGCGLGRNANAAADRGHEVTAIDTSATAIESCRANDPSKRISFHVLDAANTGLTPGFDVIVDSATYHAIPAPKRVAYLTEMRRLATAATTFHIVTFAPSIHGMPKPLAIELSEIAEFAEQSGFCVSSVARVEYKGNRAAIEDFCKKKGLDIRLDDEGRSRLPAWHVTLRTTI